MSKYNYITEVIQNGKSIACKNYSSLAKQTDDACNLVRSVLTDKALPSFYIRETIQCFTRDLRKKNVSKEKYYHTLHYDYGLQLKMTRKAI